MGDIFNMKDIDRFLRSSEGQAHLEEIRTMLKGRTITDVSFSNLVQCVETTLHLDDSEIFVIYQPSLDVEMLREEFAEVIQREYYVDFPECKPEGQP